MSNILFAWELGGNLGHLAKQMMIARALRQRGHRCLFAARDVAVASTLLTNNGFEFVQAPFHCTPEGEAKVLTSYADILSVNGFGTPELLSGLVHAWFVLLERFRPEVIVIEYSPTVLFAAKLTGIPMIQIDTGFGYPPNEVPFPNFRPWLGITATEQFATEQALLATVNTVCSRLGGTPFSSLQQMLTTGTDLLATVPELDHYQGRRFGCYVGPLFNISDGCEAFWPEKSGSRIFVYLRPFDGLEVVLKALSERSLVIIAVIPGIDAQLAAKYSCKRFQIIANPVQMSGILPVTDIAITHAGHGLASACVQFGVPMLLIPQMIEQLMTTQNLERLGVGIRVNHDQVAEKFAQGLDRLLTEQTFRKNARTLASKYEVYDQEKVLENMADTIEGIINRKTTISLKHNCSYSLPISCLPGTPTELLPCK